MAPPPGDDQAALARLVCAVEASHALLCAFTCAEGPSGGLGAVPLPGRLCHTQLWSVAHPAQHGGGGALLPTVYVRLPLPSRVSAGSAPACTSCWAASLYAALPEVSAYTHTHTHAHTHTHTRSIYRSIDR